MKKWDISKPIYYYVTPGIEQIPPNTRSFKVTSQTFTLKGDKNSYFKSISIERFAPITAPYYSVRWKITTEFNSELNFGDLKRFVDHHEDKEIVENHLMVPTKTFFANEDDIKDFLKTANNISEFSDNMKISIAKLIHPHSWCHKINLLLKELFPLDPQAEYFQHTKHATSHHVMWKTIHPCYETNPPEETRMLFRFKSSF